MVSLDDMEKIKGIDSEGMLEVEENFYNQLVEAKKIAERTDFSKLKGISFKGIAFLGMGGSGYAGDMVKSLIKNEAEIPIEVVKGYNLPAYVREGWLAVPLSYSGNTEETISAASQALERGCYLLFVCSGGKLEKTAASNNKTVIKIPSGLQPRGATGFLFFPTLLALNYLKVIKVSSADIEEALEIIREKAGQYNRKVKAGKNPAKALALKISDKLPIIYGAEGYLSAIACRLKCEINENSKTPCWWNEFPELNHNETVGWERLKGTTGGLVLIVFRDEDENIRMKTRIDVTLDLIKENVSDIIEIPVKGKSKLAKALSAMYIGDIASVYLALLANIDPGPVEKINHLKNELAKLG